MRATQPTAGNPAADPGDEPRQSTLGRSPHSWRAPQARYRHRPDLRCEVYGAAKATSVARLENVPPQPSGWGRLNRPVRGSNHSFESLYGLLILRHDRRRILWVGVTPSPTAEWIARQVSEACGWEPLRITSFVIATVSTARHLRAAFARWAFATDRQRHDRRGRTVTLND